MRVFLRARTRICGPARVRARAHASRGRSRLLELRLLCCSLADDFLLWLGLGQELAADGNHRHESDKKDEVLGVLFPFGLHLLACKHNAAGP